MIFIIIIIKIDTKIVVFYINELGVVVLEVVVDGVSMLVNVTVDVAATYASAVIVVLSLLDELSPVSISYF